MKIQLKEHQNVWFIEEDIRSQVYLKNLPQH